MITDIQVSGFKSLEKFEFNLRPGLNVLVGPNGSGKSNILSLFEFVSFISKYSLAEAVSRAGGAGALFTRTTATQSRNPINISISGYGKQSSNAYALPPRFGRTSQQRDYFVEYNYECSITLSEKGTSLRYDQQRLSFSVFNNENSRSLRNANTNDKRWHVDIVIKTEGDKVNILRNKINRNALKKVIGAGFTKPSLFQIHYVVEPTKHPLFHSLHRILPPLQKVISDISSGYIYNLNPSAIKQPEDIARAPEISADGSGLAATLFFIEERERQGPFGPYDFVSTYDSGLTTDVSLQRLREMFCLINNNIKDVRVENDALENKLIVVAKVNKGHEELEIPLAMLSDGTVKWFSLVTAVLRQRAIFSLEEPENFLHPLMQKEIVDMLREGSADKAENFSLMTTHSESLLNALDPSEVAVVRMVEGRTMVFRSPNSGEIRDEINRSGFGLGHFYVAGALDS